MDSGKASPRARRGGRKWALAALALAAAFALWRFAGGKEGERAAPPPALVRTQPAERRDVPRKISAVGNVVPYESVAVRARIDSQLMEVRFKDGDEVKAGDLLFVLDDRAIRAQVAESEANIARDRAQGENYRQQFQRNKTLTRQGYKSQAALDEAQALYNSQLAVVRASEAALQNARVLLEYTRIHAPISGRTGTINVTLGNTVKANDTQPLVVINQLKPIRVQLSLPQGELESVRRSMAEGTVEAVVEREGGAGELARGTLEYLDNAVDPATGTFAARASFANENEALWPGMFVPVTLILGVERGVLAVPERAVQRGQGEQFVFVVEDGKALKRPVKVARSEGGVTVIASGLEADEKIVTDGALSLADGSKVREAQAEPAGAKKGDAQP